MPSTYRRRLLGAVLVALCAAPLTPAPRTATAATALPPQPGAYRGLGFDACAAPSSDAMKSWLQSPYRAAGIYFGGNNRGCQQPNLTPSWVREQVARGWRLIPLYVGPQATCTTSTKKHRIDNAHAEKQGRTTADDAVAQARALGLSRESVLIYDMEAYRTGDAACRAGVLAFMSGWTARLHDHGYLSGFYSSVGSGVADQVAAYHRSGYVRPDYLDFARWDQVVTTADKVVPSSYWTPGRRMKQYRGDHRETWGGVTINIDNDYLDFARLPAARSGDWNRNGWADVLARTTASGDVIAYPGNGTYVSEANRTPVAGGFAGVNAIVRMDLDRDGQDDIIARTRAGALYLYPGKGNGRLGTRTLLTARFGHMRELTAIGDLNRDGYPDLLASQISNGDVYLYPGRKGARFGARTVIAYGNWADRGEFTGAGDYTGDGYPDLLVTENRTGTLYLYPGKGTGLRARVRVGRVSGLRDLTGVGDFDRDGFTDVMAVRAATGDLLLLRGTGGSLRAPVKVASGYRGRSPLF